MNIVCVFPSWQFGEDIAFVVISERARELVVTHARSILAPAPSARNFRRLMNEEFAAWVSPVDDVSVTRVRQQL